MKKKKKNSTAYLELRTGAFAVLTLTGLVVMAYASFGILLSWLISQNTPETRTDLNITIFALAIAVFLLLRFAWFNGKKLWGEWQFRRESNLVDDLQEPNFDHLADEVAVDEEDLEAVVEAKKRLDVKS